MASGPPKDFHIITSFLGRRTVLDSKGRKLQSMFIGVVRSDHDVLVVRGWACKIDEDITNPFAPLYESGIDIPAVDLEFSWPAPAANDQLQYDIGYFAKLTISIDLEYVSTLFVSSMVLYGGRPGCMNTTHWKTMFMRFPSVCEVSVEDQAADGLAEALTAKVSSGDSCLPEEKTTTWVVFPKLTTLKFRNVNCRHLPDVDQECFSNALKGCLRERSSTLQTIAITECRISQEFIGELKGYVDIDWDGDVHGFVLGEDELEENDSDDLDE